MSTKLTIRQETFGTDDKGRATVLLTTLFEGNISFEKREQMEDLLKDWRDNDKDYLQYEKEDEYEILGEGVSELVGKLGLDYKDEPLYPQHVYSVELW